MKAKFAKVLGLALVLALALSGCNLIEIDPRMQADEDIAKIEKAYAAPVAAYAGGELTAADVMGDFNNAYNEMATYYSYFGYSMTHDDVHMLVEDVLNQKVRARVIAEKYDAENSLGEDKLAEVEQSAQENYDYVREGLLASAVGDSEEARQENLRVLLAQTGMDYDSIYESLLLNAKVEAMEEIVRAEIAELSDEELQTAYDAHVEEQEISFTDGSSFENAMTGEDTVVCWRPDGYRSVKHILVIPEDEIMSAYSEAASALSTAQADMQSLEDELAAANDDELAEGERSVEDIQTEMQALGATIPAMETAVKTAEQACLDNVKATTDEIYARLEAGEAFEDLIAEYGEDPGMQNEPTMTRGYYVSEASQNWEANFRDAAMALGQAGDYSEAPVVSGSGVHIIYYNGDVAGGAVPLEEVRDALYAETLEAAQIDHCDATIEDWVEAAAPSYDVEAFEAALELE